MIFSKITKNDDYKEIKNGWPEKLFLIILDKLNNTNYEQKTFGNF